VFVCILPEKAVPEMTYTVSGRTLNPTHSLTCSSENLVPPLSVRYDICGILDELTELTSHIFISVLKCYVLCLLSSSQSSLGNFM